MAQNLIRNLARFGRRLIGIDEHARVFNRYYRSNAWIGGGSGAGSTEQVTYAYRIFLSEFLTKYKIESVVDVGCGDWQFSRLMDWSGIDYLGIDVSKVVLQNTVKFAKAGISFKEMNAIKGTLPPADLLIMKDVIQHWTNSDILGFLPQLAKFKFALITNGSHRGSVLANTENQIGGCRPVDLARSPFNVNGEYVLEFQADEPKITFLWRRGA